MESFPWTVVFTSMSSKKRDSCLGWTHRLSFRSVETTMILKTLQCSGDTSVLRSRCPGEDQRCWTSWCQWNCERKQSFWTRKSCQVPSLPPRKKKPSSVDEESRKWQLTGPVAPLPTRRAGAADFEHAWKHTQTHSLFLLDSVESLVYVTGLATFNHYRQDNSQPSH